MDRWPMSASPQGWAQTGSPYITDLIIYQLSYQGSHNFLLQICIFIFILTFWLPKLHIYCTVQGDNFYHMIKITFIT